MPRSRENPRLPTLEPYKIRYILLLSHPPLAPPEAHSTAQHSREGTMRDVLLRLPDDVSRGIVMEWLEPADVARLDSAYNHHEESEVFRGLLSSPLSLFDVSDEREENSRWLRWAMKRRLHLGSIRIHLFQKICGLPLPSRPAWTDS